MSEFLWRPILEGMWKQCEAFDGTYDFADLCEVNAVLEWRDKQLERAREDNARS